MDRKELFNQTVALLQNGDTAGFKSAFDAGAGEYIKTKVREGSLAEKILTPKSITANSPNVQKYLDRDAFYYVMEIEKGAKAYRTTFRNIVGGEFVDQPRMAVDLEKIETLEYQKPKIELEVANNLFKMLEENGIEEMCRIQDGGLFTAFNICINGTTNAISAAPGSDGGPVGSNNIVCTLQSSGFNKSPFVSLLQMVAKKELKNAKFIMSDVMFLELNKVDHAEVGNLVESITVDGYTQKKFLGMEVLTSIKSTLEGPIDNYYPIAENLGTYYATPRIFDFVDGSGNEYSNVYVVGDPEYIGLLLTWGGKDEIWSEWKKDIFHWQAWRTSGVGIGNINTIGRLTLKRVNA